jgi:hypothetical protein
MTVEDLNTAPSVESEVNEAAQVSAPQAPEISEDDAMGEAYEAAMKGDSPEKERGEDGKFKSAKGDEKASLEGEGNEAAEEGSTASTAAPAHLPQAIKASWEQIPVEAREAIAKHQGEMDRKFAEVGRQMQAAKPIMDKLTQAQQTVPIMQGMTPQQLADGALQLAAVQVQLDRGTPQQRTETLMQIANHYGVLPQIAAMVSGQQPDQQVTSLHQEIAQLRQLLGQQQVQNSPDMIEGKFAEMMRVRDAEQAVEGFAKSMPLFADVEATLPRFVEMARDRMPEADMMAVLEAAYDMAVHADPEARKKLLDLEANAATTSNGDTERRDAAKRAASINVKGHTSGKTRQASEDELMSAAWERAMAS